MKILSICDKDIWPGGEGVGIPSIFASHRGFVEKGHSVYFLCPLTRKNYPRENIYYGITIRRFELPFNIGLIPVSTIHLDSFFSHVKSTLLHNLRWLFSQLYSCIHGIRIASMIKPDIVYIHGLGHFIPGWLVSKLFKTKLIVRVYGVRDLYWRWNSIWFRFKEIRNYLTFKVPANYFIIAKDGTYGERLARKLGVSSRRIKTWRNGVYFDMFDPNPGYKKEICRDFNIDPSSKIIISVGRLIPFKGVDRIVFAIPELFKREDKSILIIAGEGPQRKRLERFVEEHNIQNRVLFIGNLDHKKLARLLNVSDIFISLSRYSDCSNALWEAMVCGRCIVTIERESIKDIFTQGENAVLIPENNLEKLPLVLNTLLLDSELKNRLGSNVRLRSKEIFESWDDRIDKEIALLEQLVGV